jgi:hypothetical protein
MIPSENIPEPLFEKIDTRAGLESGIDRVLALAQSRIAIFAKTLGPEWNAEPRVDMLRAVCLKSRRNQIRIVVHEPAPVYAQCPRLLGLLRQFSHVLAIHETQLAAKHVYDPFVLVENRHFLHRFHFDGPRGLLAMHEPNEAKVLQDKFEELWAASDPTISATTLGL